MDFCCSDNVIVLSKLPRSPHGEGVVRSVPSELTYWYARSKVTEPNWRDQAYYCKGGFAFNSSATFCGQPDRYEIEASSLEEAIKGLANRLYAMGYKSLCVVVEDLDTGKKYACAAN